MRLGLPIQWRIGGVMLLAGGALSSIGATLFSFAPQGAGSVLTFVAVFLEGAGLITVSFAFASERVPVWARRSLFASGVVIVIEFVLAMASILLAGIPAVVSAVLYVVAGATLLLATIAIFRGIPAGRTVRWALLPAGLFQAAIVLLAATGYGGEWWTLAILGILYMLAGVVFVTYRPVRTTAA